MDEWDAYIDEMKDREDLTYEEVVRTAAERGWGPMGSCWCLRHIFQIPLSEAKGLTATLCDELGLKK